jgi:hypothetical protein
MKNGVKKDSLLLLGMTLRRSVIRATECAKNSVGVLRSFGLAQDRQRLELALSLTKGRTAKYFIESFCVSVRAERVEA